MTRPRAPFVFCFFLVGILSLTLQLRVKAQSGFGFTPVNITTATTTLLVTDVGTNAIYVQNMGLTFASAIGTDTSIQFVAGTGLLCAGSQVNVSGAIGVYSGATSGGIQSLQAQGGSYGLLKAPGGLNLCAVTVSNNRIAGYLVTSQGPS